MTTPRTHDDGRNERQRAQHAREMEQEHERSRERDQREARQGERRTDEQEPHDFKKAEGKERDRLLDEKPYDFIERTKPEDRLDQTNHPGQLTRDNVNPNIPSVAREETGPPERRVPNPGGIVDPETLGMDQGQHGTQPPEPENKSEQWPSLGLDHTKRGEDQAQEQENRQRQAEEGSGGLGEKERLPSINEPPGSRVFTGEEGPNQIPEDPKHDLPPLVLSDIDPDSAQTDSMTDITLTVTGSGFTPNTVILFDDEELPTTFVNQTTLTASPPAQAEAAVIDVEVQRGEEMSDVLTFEFVAPAGTRSSQKGERKPKKSEPAHKRANKRTKGKK